MLMFHVVVAAFLLAAIAWPAAAVTGTATVIDGDDFGVLVEIECDGC